MPELIDAKTAAERTAEVRGRAFEEFKTYMSKRILAATATGDYYVGECLPGDWDIKKFKSFWYFFADKGYELSIAGVTDFAITSELYINKDFRGLTISWGDDS